MTFARLLSITAGLALLAISAPTVAQMPLLGAWLIVAALVYAAALLRWPRLWLVVLPVFCVSIDFTTWHGRLLFNELDWLFIVTIAVALLAGRFRGLRLARGPGAWLLLAYLAVSLFAMARAAVFVDPPAVLLSNPYYVDDYSYKLIKGLVWGLILAGLWAAQRAANPQATLRWLLTGSCLAACMLGVVVLWERGTLGLLLSGAEWYHVVNSLLDLSASYRVTGIFAEMHTGGEVIDGAIALLLPLALYTLHRGSYLPLRLLGGLGALALAYVTLVGFTRSTYAVVALEILIYLALLAWQQRRGLGRPSAGWVLLPAAGAVLVLAAQQAFAAAGSYGLVAFGALLVLAYIADSRRLLGDWMTASLVTSAVLFLLLFAADAHRDSRWVEASTGSMVLLLVPLAASFPATLFLLRPLRNWRELDRLIALASVIVGAAVFAFAATGSQIQSRFDTAERDMDARLEHWQRVIDSGDDSAYAQLFGNGVGSYPRNYLVRFPETVRRVGSFEVREDEGGYLRLGASEDLAFGQRVTIRPDSRYRVDFSLRSDGPGAVAAFLCERNLIFASNFMANCAAKRLNVPDTAGQFEDFSLVIDSGRVGRASPLRRWPTMLYLKNFKSGSTVDLRSVALLGEGSTALRNNRFQDGTDHWFFYNDFVHLPWHIKNQFLHTWYETGGAGLVLLLLCLAAAALRTLRGATPGGYELGFVTAVLGLAALGMFGTPLDSARVGWLFYFLLSALLLAPSEMGARPEAAG